MRYIFLVFGYAFFCIVFAAGIFAERSFELVVRDSCIGALLGGLVGQWFWKTVLSAMAETAAKKRAKAEAEAKAARKKKSAETLAAVRK
jgi:hypothetical protein